MTAKFPAKILYIQGVTRMGGAIESLLLLVRNIDSEGFIPKIVTSAEGTFAEELKSSGINPAIIKMEMWRKARGFIARPYTIRKLRNITEQEGISLIHCNTMWDNPYGVAIAEKLRIPIVCHTRNTFTKDKIKKYRLDESDRIICVSNAISGLFRGWIDENKVTTIYNGVDLEKFDITKTDVSVVRYEFGISKDETVIGLVGRIAPEKGQYELIKACSKLKEKRYEFRVLIVGEPSKKESGYLNYLKKTSAECGVEDRIVFTGFRRDIEKITASFDIAAFPSLETANEGFGRGIIEAMALGKPVIGSATGGIPEVIEEGKTGFLVEPENIKMLTEKIETLISNKPLQKELGERGRMRARTLFSVESYVNAVEKIYSELL